MKHFFLSLSICVSMLFYKSSFAQCPTVFYTTTSTTNGSTGSGSNSSSNPGAMLDGDVNTSATLTSNNSTPADPASLFIDVTLSATIPANSYFYLKVSDVTSLTVQAYNGAIAINPPAITITPKVSGGLSFFELNSTQPVTRFRVTFTNSAGLQSRLIYELYSGTQCDLSLPVSLTSFTAKSLNNKTVQLDWTSSMEQNNDYFLVERSKDLVQFESITQVKAKEGNLGHTYSFVDENPYNGTSYYRLRQVDLNGATSAFPAVSVVLRSDAYGIFPNPLVDGKFTLRLDEPKTAVINLYSADGRVLTLQKTGIEEGALLLKTAKNLPTGVYILTVEERAQIRKHRLVIQ